MDHHHHEDDTYFLDQICTVALSGAFGVICLCLYFVQQGMLFRLLGAQFHPFVLASGIALLVVAVIRAATLWSQAGARASEDESVPSHRPDALPLNDVAEAHGHSHSHEHSHGDHGHDHSHGHGDHGHDHGHSHSHAHDHGHSHAEIAQSRAFGHTPNPAPAASHSHASGHEDHDHGWAPWRYVVLLVPIILFMLGLPSKGPSIDDKALKGVDTTRDVLEESVAAVTLAAMGANPLPVLGAVAVRFADAAAGDIHVVDVKLLEGMAALQTDREHWKGKSIRVRGQFAPRTERLFFLVRFRIQCCAGDAVQVSIPVLTKEPIAEVKTQSWIEITGRVDFREDQGKFKTVVLVNNRAQVQPCNPDLNPYLQ